MKKSLEKLLTKKDFKRKAVANLPAVGGSWYILGTVGKLSDGRTR